MKSRQNRIAHALSSFVENPITTLVKGTALLLIGLSDASHTVLNDATQRHIRVGHGLIIIGLFSVLGALPQLIESLEAGERFMEQRERKAQSEIGENRP